MNNKIYLVLLLIPAWIIFFVRKKKIFKELGFIYGTKHNHSIMLKRYKFHSTARLICWSIAWICLAISLTNPTWGSQATRIQKSGNALCFVFDISQSMLAQDVEKTLGNTRLESAANYAQILLAHLPQTEVASVITKGSAIIAVPLTNDFSSIYNLTQNLSPQLISTIGSNPGNGISVALKSFPSQVAKHSSIIIFTDGGESFDILKEASLEAAKFGVNIIFVGFGSTEGSYILAGDGKTKIKTALEEQKLIDICNYVNSKTPSETNFATYINPLKKGSANKIINIVQKDFSSTSEEKGIEIQDIQRHGIFIFAALFFLCLGFIIGELHFNNLKIKKTNTLIIFLALLLFSSCTQNSKTSFNILLGTLNYHNHNYQKSISKFLIESKSATNELKPYSQIGLASSYLMLGDSNNALQKMLEISEDSPEHILYALHYNSGIAAYNNSCYKEAAQCFKKAIQIDNTKLEAKINYELSMKQISFAKESKQEINELQKSKKSNSTQNAIFSIIKEDEQQRWQSYQKNQNLTTANDY